MKYLAYLYRIIFTPNQLRPEAAHTLPLGLSRLAMSTTKIRKIATTRKQGGLQIISQHKRRTLSVGGGANIDPGQDGTKDIEGF